MTLFHYGKLASLPIARAHGGEKPPEAGGVLAHFAPRGISFDPLKTEIFWPGQNRVFCEFSRPLGGKNRRKLVRNGVFSAKTPCPAPKNNSNFCFQVWTGLFSPLSRHAAPSPSAQVCFQSKTSFSHRKWGFYNSTPFALWWGIFTVYNGPR